MIPLDYITEWRENAPWQQISQVEQDLIICRALVELYRHPVAAANLVFRGGTALFKLHLPPGEIFRRYRSGAERARPDRSSYGCGQRKTESLAWGAKE